MSNDGVNNGRRRFLVAATSVVGAAGAVGVAVPFLGSWVPSARAKAAGAPVKVNVSKLEPGQQIVAEWRGQPVFVSRRTDEAMAILAEMDAVVADPESKSSVQPSYVDPKTRSIRGDVLVVVGICTHLGCSPLFRPEVASADMGADWKGGYFCPCHSSRYDMSGRVFRGQPAPLNLPVPPHSYESDDIIVIGVDQETA